MVKLGYPVDATTLCPQIEFRTGQPVPELSNLDHGAIEMNETAMTVHIAGNDFGILVPAEPLLAEDAKEVWVSAAGDVGNHCSIYWRNADSDFSEERSTHVNFVPRTHTGEFCVFVHANILYGRARFSNCAWIFSMELPQLSMERDTFDG